MTQVRVGWRAYVNPFTPEDPGTPNTIDQDVTNFILASGISDSVQTSAIETLVSDLKSYGLWTKMKALYPFVGGSAASHKWNLKDPRDLDAAFRLVFNGGGVHSSTGYQLNGSNSWADTKLIPSNILSSNGKVSLGFYSRTNRTGANRVAMGSFTNPTSGFMIYPRYTDNKAYFGLADDSNGNPPSVTSTLGFYQGARNNSTTQSLSNINGNNYSYNYNTTSLPNTSVYIGTVNYNPTSYVENLELAFSYVGEDLSATDLSNYYTAVQKFQTTLGRHVGTPYVSDPDAVAFLNAAGITDGTQASAINTLVTRMKADGVWTKMKAIYPFVGGTAASHKWNLKDPRDLDAAFRLGFYGGWTHTSTGALPNGTTGYADTNVTPSSRLASTSGFGFYSRTNSTVGSQADMGALYYFPVQAFGSSAVGTTRYFASNSNDYSSFTDTDTRGFYQTYRTDSTTVKSLKNTTLYSATLSYATPNLDILIGARNEIGVAQVFSLKEFAFAYVQENFTDSDATALYSTVQAFQTTLGRQVNIPVVSDTDAQTFLNAANITSFQQASAVNKLVVDLKAAGVWTKMKAIYPFVGGSAASHKFNLKDPRDLDAAYRLVFNGGWTHTSTGSQPNGTTGYADTKLAPNVMTQNSVHVSVYSRTNVDGVYLDVYGEDGGSGIGMIIKYGGISRMYLNTLLSDNVSNSNPSTGLFVASRTASATSALFQNSTKIITGTRTSLTPSTFNIYLGAGNYSGTPSLFSTRQQAFASIGDGLTDTEATALYTAVQTYQTSLGRQVTTPIYNNGLVLNLDAGNANSYPGTGTTWFDLASGNNGTLVNGPIYDATNGGSLLFDGVNDRITSFPTKLPDTSSKTIDIWFKSTSSVRQGLCGIRDGVNVTGWVFTINRTSTGNLTYFNTGQGTVEVSAGITTNIWYNAVLTHDYSTGVAKIYLNGKLLGTGNASGYNSSTFNGVIGDEDGSFTTPFKGNIPKVTMYNRVLTDVEVLNNFNSTRGRFGL